MFDGNLEIVAKTFAGLEEVLEKEVLKIGGREITKQTRAVVFQGDIGTVYKANLKLRTAVKVLVSIKQFAVRTQSEYNNRLNKMPWEDIFDLEDTFAIDIVANGGLFSNSMYAGQLAKDAIVDRFRKKYGKRPSVDKYNADIKIHIHINHKNVVSVSLDSSGDLLFKRGYKTGTGIAPINEVLAAGIIQLTDWDKTSPFIDPMCGSGTLLVEAAMLAGDIPAGIFRDHFGFKNWKGYDKELFLKIKSSMIDRSSDPVGIIKGYDIDSFTLSKAEENVENAMLEEQITLENKDFFTSTNDGEKTWLIFNPPYNQRIGTDPDFYKRIGDTLKTNYKNSTAWFITADLEGIKNVGLRTSKKIPLINGDLDCRLVKYDIIEGKWNR